MEMIIYFILLPGFILITMVGSLVDMLLDHFSKGDYEDEL